MKSSDGEVCNNAGVFNSQKWICGEKNPSKKCQNFSFDTRSKCRRQPDIEVLGYYVISTLGPDKSAVLKIQHF